MDLKNKISHQIQIANLLVKEAFGTLTGEEISRLDIWKEEQSNKLLYDGLFEGDKRKRREKIADGIDLEKEWSTFLEGQEVKRGIARRIQRIRLYAAAASIAVLIAVSSALMLRQGGLKGLLPVLVSQPVVIPPGQTRAELILNDGEVIYLEDVRTTLIQDDEIVISNDCGILEYESRETEAETVALNTLKVPRGGEYMLILEDSTIVWLNSETRITYPVYFSGKERKVELTGEAFFKVARDEQRPFIVETNQQEVKVLGTAFNISAYPGEESIYTTLVEGSVEVSFPGEGDQPVRKEVIEPNQQLIYGHASHTVELIEVSPYLYTSWKDGRFVFRNEPLISIMGTLSRWYDIDVVFEDEGIKEVTFTGDLKRYSDLTDLLRILELEMSVRTKIVDHNRLLIKY
ncbi:MAG: FecR domain-containing protein [Bacteroidota bacterium]